MDSERRNAWIFALLAAAVFAVDQLTKHWASALLEDRGSVFVLENFFWLTLVHNPHGAFGLFADWAGHYRKAVLVALPIAAVAFFVWFFLKNCRASLWQTVAFGLIVGGAAGNLMDRLLHGYVVDFLDFHWRDRWHWPAFNAADSAVTVGAALLVIDHLFLSRGGGAAPSAGETPDVSQAD